MKRNAIFTLIKDILFAAVAWGIAFFLINGIWGVDAGGTMDATMANTMAMMFAGVPFGWRWTSKIISATSIKGVGIKLLISVFLGWIAIFVTMVVDAIGVIVHLVKAKRPVPAA